MLFHFHTPTGVLMTLMEANRMWSKVAVKSALRLATDIFPYNLRYLTYSIGVFAVEVTCKRSRHKQYLENVTAHLKKYLKLLLTTSSHLKIFSLYLEKNWWR